MKILYITHLTERNGSTIALLNIIKGVLGVGVDVGLVVPEQKGWLYEECKKIDVDILYIGYLYDCILKKPKTNGFLDILLSYYRYCRYLILLQRDFYRLIKKYKPDIVHCNNGTIDYALFGCWLLKIPFVWHIREYQDLDFNIDIFPSKKILIWKMHRSFVRCIAITNGVFQHFGLSQKKDTVIYDGIIDDSKITEKHEVYEYKNYFLYVGSLGEGKGLHVAIDSFIAFHRKNPSVNLLIAGKIYDNSEYYIRCQKKIIENDLTDHILFLDYRSDVDVLMQNAIALLVPSYFEGFGFITVEAMYNHCLVIGRNTAGTKEQFDNGLKQTGAEIGLRFNDENEIESLMKLAMETDFTQMKRRAYCMVANNYSISKNVSEIMHVYLSALNK